MCAFISADTNIIKFQIIKLSVLFLVSFFSINDDFYFYKQTYK